MSNDTTEAAMRDATAEFVRAVWGNGEPPPFMSGVVRRGLEAARPLMPEAQALARVRALCDEWDARGGGYGILGPTLRAAIEQP